MKVGEKSTPCARMAEARQCPQQRASVLSMARHRARGQTARVCLEPSAKKAPGESSLKTIAVSDVRHDADAATLSSAICYLGTSFVSRTVAGKHRLQMLLLSHQDGVGL